MDKCVNEKVSEHTSSHHRHHRHHHRSHHSHHSHHSHSSQKKFMFRKKGNQLFQQDRVKEIKIKMFFKFVVVMIIAIFLIIIAMDYFSNLMAEVQAQ